MLRLILGVWILSALLRGPRYHGWGGWWGYRCPPMGMRRPPMGMHHPPMGPWHGRL